MTDKETERRLIEEQKMASEMQRVRALLQKATELCAEEGGDIRYLNAALMTGAIQLHAEVEGVATLERALTCAARREMIRAGKAGSC